MKRMFGFLMVLMGIALGCWIAYASFIAPPPDGQRINPAPAILFCLGLLIVGAKWTRGD